MGKVEVITVSSAHKEWVSWQWLAFFMKLEWLFSSLLGTEPQIFSDVGQASRYPAVLSPVNEIPLDYKLCSLIFS